MSWLSDAFASDLMRRALIGGLLAGTITALVGTWVVIRGLAFFGDALAHGVLPGIALAVLWGVNVTLGAAVSAVVMVGGVNLVNRTTRLSDDTGIGLLFIGTLALGVVVISTNESHAGDLTSLLFGDVLGVQDADLRVGAITLVVVAAVLVVGHRAFLALSLDRDKAKALGLRPGLANVAMLATVAAAVVACFRVVGTLLVFAFLIAPPATAMLVVRRIGRIMVAAVCFAWVSVIVGLTISYHADTAAAATCAMVAVALFFAVLVGVESSAALRRRRLRAIPRAGR